MLLRMDLILPSSIITSLRNIVNNTLLFQFVLDIDASMNVDSLSFEEVQQLVVDFKKIAKQSADFFDDWADLSEFDKQFKAVKNDRPFKRQTQITRKIDGIHESELNHKEGVKFQVTERSMKKGGVFSSDFVAFQVETEIPGQRFKYLVQRKDSDFYALRKVLVARFPYCLVPPLPPKSTATSESEATRRLQIYNRFLEGVNKSQILKTSKFLVDFLKIIDRTEWKFNKKINEQLKFSRKIEDVLSVDGEVKVDDQKQAVQFCDRVKQTVDEYGQLAKEIMGLSREVHSRSGQLAQIINKLAECFERLGKFNKKLKVKSQDKLFTKLSGLYYSSSLNLQNQGELTKIYCGQAMKVYEFELQPLHELSYFRDSFKQDFIKQQERLNTKKNELFAKDLSSWGYTFGTLDELISRSDVLRNDKAEAFKYMLSDETQKLHEVSEELNFYTNQCLLECRRVGKNNGDQLIEHFMDQAMIQCDYIEAQRDKWAQFVDYFGNFSWENEPQTKSGKEAKKNMKKNRGTKRLAQPKEEDDSLLFYNQGSITQDGGNYSKKIEHLSTLPSDQKATLTTFNGSVAGFDFSSDSASPREKKIKICEKPPTEMTFSSEVQVFQINNNIVIKGILKNKKIKAVPPRPQTTKLAVLKPADSEPLSLKQPEIKNDNDFFILEGDPKSPVKRQSFKEQRNELKQGREPAMSLVVEETKEQKKFALSELVDHPNDVTFTETENNLKDKVALDDDSQFEFNYDRALNDESRPSIVSDLLDSKRHSILNQKQIDRLKFAEEISTTANQLKPISTTQQVSAKVQNFLTESAKSKVTVKLNDQLKRQITKMISLRIKDAQSEDDDDESDDDSQ